MDGCARSRNKDEARVYIFKLRQNWQSLEAHVSRREGATDQNMNKASGKADDLLYILEMRPKYNR